MKQVIINNVPDKKYPIFMEMIKSLGYIAGDKTGSYRDKTY